MFQKVFGLDPLMAVKTPQLLGDTKPLVLRGMFNILYEEQLAEQKKKLGPNWKPQSPLPPRSGVVTPREWARAFRGILRTLVTAKKIRRPQVGQEFNLTSKGIEKIHQYRREGERIRTGRILDRMQDHLDEVLKRLPKTEPAS